MPLCQKGDGYFIGIYSKKLDRRTIIALNAQHMTSLLSDQMAQLFLTYDVSTLTQNIDYKLLSFFKDPSTAAPTTMNPTTVPTTTVTTGPTEGIYSKHLLEKYLEGRN